MTLSEIKSWVTERMKEEVNGLNYYYLNCFQVNTAHIYIKHVVSLNNLIKKYEDVIQEIENLEKAYRGIK